MVPAPSLKAFGICLLCLLLLGGCTPARRIAADHGLYSPGNPPFSFTFDSSLSLAGAGLMQADVPSDTNIRPIASIRYAVFAEGTSGPVSRHAHALIGTLPYSVWRWELESWPPAASLSLTKKEEDGKFWTVQMMPIAALGDWFSAFWQSNNRDIPRFWLLKRWSSTPFDETRILAEYREPAPLCMEEALLPLEGIVRREQVSPPDGVELLLLCRKEIRDFSARADAAVSLKKTIPLPEPGALPAFTRPGVAPDMKRLAGVAELVDHGDSEVAP
jgi:hypothetical protein